MKKKTVLRKTVARKKKNRSPLFFYIIAFSLLLTVGFFAKSDFIANSQRGVQGASSPDEIIVKYKSATPESERENQRRTSKTFLKKRIDKLRMEVVKIQEGTVDEKINQYKKNPFVEYAEPNFKAVAFSITNDSSLSQQWGLYKINAANQSAESAWDVTNGSAGVKVAVLDTGIEESHFDLSGKIVGSANFTDSVSANDQNGHGTHVAGITAAATNNSNGVAGTGYNTVLLNGKVLGDDGSGYYSWIANGVVWAADQGANVINLSLGGPSSSLALQDAVNYAWSKGVVIVAAAGNSNTSSPSYPAYYTNTVAVAATDPNDNKASFSNYGSWVDIAAPGTSIYSTYKGNTYTSLSGTSMATPLAAGTAALIWAKGSCTTNVCVREKLEKTADQISGTGSLWVWGRINAYNAVADNTASPSPTIAPTATATPTQLPTPMPTQTSSLMTVSNISMSYNVLSGDNRRINTTVTVIKESNQAVLSSAIVKAIITSPSGKNTAYSGKTNTRGQVTFSLRASEKGTYTTTVTDVIKTSYTYRPTITSTTILVQ